MKIICALGFFGGLMGAAIAILAHFLSRTVPSTYYVGTMELGRQVNATLATPLVHPSWWPMLPLVVGAGLVVGLVAGFVADRSGIRLVWRTAVTHAA